MRFLKASLATLELHTDLMIMFGRATIRRGATHSRPDIVGIFFLMKIIVLKKIQVSSLAFSFCVVYVQFCSKQKSGRWFLSTKF